MTVIFLSTHFAIFGCIIDLHQPEQVFCEVSAELFTLISDHLHGTAELANLLRKNGFGHRRGLFVLDGCEFIILGERICNAKFVLFVVPQGSEWPKEVSMDPLARLSAIGEGGQESRVRNLHFSTWHR